MRHFLFFLSIVTSIFLFTIEKENKNNNTLNKNENNPSNISKSKTINKSSNRTKKKRIYSRPPPNINETGKKFKGRRLIKRERAPRLNNSPSDISDSDTENIPNKEVYSLNDLLFDMILQNGNNFRWLVILYSETCGHCEFARRELRRIFPLYKNSTVLRFAEIEINRNPMTNMRFSIDSVPYIFLLQNNSIYEMDLYPNQKNFKIFLETNFEDVKNELKPFPPMVKLYKFAWVIIKNIMRGITNIVNEILYEHGYEFEFTPIWLIITIIMFFASICLLEYFCCSRFCPNQEEKKDANEGGKEKEKEDKEIEEEEIEEENDEEDEKEDKEITEEKKIEREKKKEKEKEKEEKINKEVNKEEIHKKDNKDIKEFKDKKSIKKKKKE